VLHARIWALLPWSLPHRLHHVAFVVGSSSVVPLRILEWFFDVFCRHGDFSRGLSQDCPVG